MADRLDKVLDKLEQELGEWAERLNEEMKGLQDPEYDFVQCQHATVDSLHFIIKEAKAAIAEDDQPAEEKPKTADNGPRPGQSMREWMEEVYQRMASSGTAEEDQAAQEKPHPHAFYSDSAYAWFMWDGWHLCQWVEGRWIQNSARWSARNPDLIARAKAAAGVGDDGV